MAIKSKHPAVTISNFPGSGPLLGVLFGAAMVAGCTSLPFQHKERTSIITPAMRIAAIRESAASVTDADPQEQASLVDDLASQIRTEHDPLVRLAIQESVAELHVPLAHQMLVAGLQDVDLDVRLTCCQMLGRRGEVESVPVLRSILASNAPLDLKLAATDAIGQINSTESVGALALSLKSRDPALQYAAVEAMKNLTEEDLGNNVADWLAFAERNTQIAAQVPPAFAPIQMASAAGNASDMTAQATSVAPAPTSPQATQPDSPFASSVVPSSPYR